MKKTSTFMQINKFYASKFYALKVFLLSLLLGCWMVGVQAATITSTSTGGDWSNTGTWVGGSIPLSTDDVVISTTGVNAVTLSVGVSCVSLTINSGSILTPAANLISLSGNFSNLGTFTSGAGGLTLIGVATQTIAGFTTTGPFTMSKTGGIATFNGNVNGNTLVVNGSGGTLNLGTSRTHTFTGILTLTAGDLDGGSSTINFSVTGAVVSGSGATFTANAGTVNYSGVAQTLGVLTYNNLTLSGTGAKTFALGTTTVNGTLSIENGNNANTYTGTLVYGAAASLRYNAGTSNRTVSTEWPTTFSGSGGVSIEGTGIITLNGAKTLSDGVSLSIITGASFNSSTFLVTLGGNLTNSGLFTSGTGGLTINGSGAQSIGGFTTSGTITMSKTSGIATFNGDVNGVALTINGVGGTLDLGAARTHSFTGNIAITAGTLDGGSANLSLSGNLTGVGTFTGNAMNLTLTGATAASILGFTTTGNLSFTKSSAGTTTLTGDVSATNLTINGSTTSRILSLGVGLSHTFSGTLTRTNGAINCGSSTVTFTKPGTVFSGTTGTFTSNTSTVIFSAASNQTLPVVTFTNLTLSGSGVKTFATAPTVNGILSMEGTATVVVTTGVVTYGAAATLRYNTATARTVSGEEWIPTFNGTGGVVISNTGEITLDANKQFGTNTNVPLTINSGSTLTTNNFNLTLHGGLTNSGTFNAGSSPFTFAGSSAAANNVASFTTTGLISFTRTAGSVTFTGSISGAGLTMSGNGGTLNLGTALSHTFTGVLTRANGVLNLSSSTLNLSSATPFSGGGGTLTIGTSTINYNGGAQTVTNLIYNNLTLSGSGIKTITTATVNGILSMEGTATASAPITYGGDATLRYNKPATFTTTNNEFPATFSGTGGVVIANTGTIVLNAVKAITFILTINTGATIDLNAITAHTSNGLILSGVLQTSLGTWGTTASAATNTNDVLFTGTGQLTISNTTTLWTAGNGTTDWSDPLNWSFGEPTSTLDAVIPSSAPFQPVFSTIAVCRDLTINSGASLTSAGFQLTMHGDLIQNGTLSLSSSALVFTGIINQNIAGFTTTGNVTMTKTAATVNFTGNVSIGSLILNGSGGTLNLGAALTHFLSGDLTITAGTLNASSANITLEGTAPQSIASFTTTGNIILTKTADVATFVGNINAAGLTLNGIGGTLNLGTGRTHTFTGTWTRTDGTLDGGSSTVNFSQTGTMFSGTGSIFTPSSGTVNFSGAGAQTIPALTFNNLTLSTSGIKTFATTPTVNGILSMQGTATVVVTVGVVTYGPNATLQYNTTTARTVSSEEWISPFSSTGGVIIASTGAISLNGAKVLDLDNPLTINAAATLTPGANLITIGGNFSNLGTLTSGSGGLTINGTAITQNISGFTTTGNVSMTKTAGTATFIGNVNAASLIVNGLGGTLDLGLARTHTFTSNITTSAGTLNGNTSNVTLAGTVAQSIAGFTTTGTISMTKTGNSVATFTGNITAGGLTLNGLSGTLNLGVGLNHTFSGTWTRSNGTLDGGSSTINFSLNGTVISGSTGTFTPNTGTVNYNGSAAQTVGQLTYNNLTLSGNGIKITTAVTVNGILTMDGTATASATITYGGDATLRFISSSPYTTSNNEFPATFNATGGVKIQGTGAVTLNGAKAINSGLTINTGSMVNLSTFSHSTKGLTLGGAGQSAGVFGGTASGAANINNTFFESTSVGTLNNTNSLTSWTGGTSSDWSIASNWSNGVPDATSLVVIPNVATQPILTAAAECNDITINVGANLSTAGFQLSFFGDLINNGTLTFSNSNIIIDGNVAQTIAGFTTSGTLTMQKTGGVATFSGNTDIGGLILNGIGGTLNLGLAFTHTLSGNLTITAGTLNASSSNIILAGTATQSIASFTTTGNITMTKTAGTATFTGNISMNSLTLNGVGGTLNFGAALTHTIRGDLLNTAGTLLGNSSNITLTGTAIQSIAGFTTTGNLTSTKTAGTATFSGDMNINNLTVNGTGGTLSLGLLRTHTFTGNLAITLGTLLGSSSTVNLSGNLTTGGTFTPNSMSIVFTGTGRQSIVAFTTTGSISMTKTAGTATIVTTAISAVNLTLNGVGGTLSMGAGLSHTFTGNIIITNGTLIGNSANFTFAGTAAQSIAGFTTTGNISMTKTALSATFTGNISATSLTISGTGGTLNLGTGLSHTFSGTLTRTSGTLNCGSSTLNLSASTPFSGSGGTFTPNLGTVNYTSAAQTVAALTYNNLTLSGSGTKTTTSVVVNKILSVEGTATVGNVITYGIAATLQYDKSSTFTTSNNEFPSTFSGTGGVIIAGNGPIVFNAQKIISNDLIINIGATVDLNAIATHTCVGITLGGIAQSVTGTYGAVGSGALTTSSFFTGTGEINFLDLTTTWNAGAATIDWHTPGNWSDGIPNSGRNALIPNIALKPTLSNDAACKSLTIYAGATLTSANFQITIHGNYTLNGSAVLGSSPIVIAGTNTQSIATIITTGNVSIVKTGGTATLQGDMSAASLILNGTGGTLDLGSALSHTFSGDITRTAGTLTGSSSNVTIAGTNTQTIAGFTTTGNISMTKTGGTATLSSNLSASNLILNGTGGTLSFGSAFTHTFTGNIAITAGTLIGASSNLVLSGAATQSIAGYTTTGSITITKTAGTATLQSNLNAAALTINGSGSTLDLGTGLTHTFTGNITLTAGTLNGGSSTINANATSVTAWTGTGSNFIPGTSTVIFGGVTQTITTPTTFNNLILSNSGVKTLTGVPTVNGIFELAGTATTSAAPNYGASATLRYNTITARNIGSEWITPFVGSGGVIIANTGAITLTGARTLNDGVPLNINALATLTPGANLITAGGDFIINGTLTSGSGGIIIDGTGAQSIGGFTTTGNFTITKSAGTATVSGNLNVTSLIFNGVGSTLNLGSALTHALSGDLTITAGTLIVGDCNITITGGATQSIAGFTTTGNILLTKTAGTATLGDNLNAGSLTLNGTGSTLNMGVGLTHTFSGDVVLTAGSLNGSSSIINVNSTSATAWSGFGSNFIAGTSTVNFGGGAQTILNATTFNNLALAAAGVKTMGGSVTVSGDLAFGANTSLAIGTNTLTLNGTLTGMSSSRFFTTNAASNLIIGGNGALGSDVFFDQTFSGTTNRMVNFTYNRSGATITLGNALQITGVVTPTDGSLATGGFLTLVSNGTGDASIAQGSGSYISGNVEVQRFIPSRNRSWRFMSSPVTSSTVEDWRGEVFITGPGTGSTTVGTTNSNGFDATQKNNNSSIFSYDETLTTGDINTGWTVPANTSATLTPGKGFRVFIRGDRSDLDRLRDINLTQNAVTLAVVNPVNIGDVNMSPTFSSSGNAANDGWNLMGNPYPCAIDWNAFHDAAVDYTNLDPTIQILNPSFGVAGQYASFNAASGAVVNGLTGGIIPSGSSFWVKASAGPTMTMKESYKTTTAPGSMFKTETSNQFSITLFQNNNPSDETVFKNDLGASQNTDRHDIQKLWGTGAQLASIAKEGGFLAANYMPLSNTNDTIPLHLVASESGNYNFKFMYPEYLALQKPIHLVDYFAGSVTDLRNNSNYAFQTDAANSKTYGSKRFALIIGPVNLTAVEEQLQASNPSIVAFPTVVSDKITIQKYHLADAQTEVIVNDISGKNVLVTIFDNWDSDKVEMDMNGLSQGTYFVTIKIGASFAKTLKCVKQ